MEILIAGKHVTTTELKKDVLAAVQKGYSYTNDFAFTGATVAALLDKIEELSQDTVEIMKPTFVLRASNTGLYCIEIDNASRKMHKFLRSVVTCNTMSHDYYKFSKAAGAFFQGGSDLQEGWVLIEFWIDKGVTDFIKFINKEWEKVNTYIPEHCPECGEGRVGFVEIKTNHIKCNICNMEFKIELV